MPRLGDVEQRPHDVVLLNELQERVEAEDGRADGRDRFRLIGVVRCSPSTLAKRSTVTRVPGLSSAKSRMSPSASTSARSTLFFTGLVRACPPGTCSGRWRRSRRPGWRT